MIILIALIFWRFILPLGLPRMTHAKTLFRIKQTRVVFFFNDNMPTFFFYLMRSLFPESARTVLERRGINPKTIPEIFGSYVIESCETDFNGNPQLERWHQDYFYINLLNGRGITFVKQFKLYSDGESANV